MDERAIEGVIFDLDGTLFDHHGSAETGLCAWLAQLGVPTRDELIATWFEAEARHMVSWQKGGDQLGRAAPTPAARFPAADRGQLPARDQARYGHGSATG